MILYSRPLHPPKKSCPPPKWNVVKHKKTCTPLCGKGVQSYQNHQHFSAQKFPPPFRFRLAAKTALWWGFLRFRAGFAALDSGPILRRIFGLHLFCQHKTSKGGYPDTICVRITVLTLQKPSWNCQGSRRAFLSTGCVLCPSCPLPRTMGP